MTKKQYQEFVSLVNKMRKVPKVKSETFPTRYRCYVPMDLVREFDEYLRRWNMKELKLQLELNDLKAVLRDMRQAQKDCMAWDHAMASGYELTEEEWEDYARSQAVRELFEKEIDEYLKEE